MRSSHYTALHGLDWPPSCSLPHSESSSCQGCSHRRGLAFEVPSAGGVQGGSLESPLKLKRRPGSPSKVIPPARPPFPMGFIVVAPCFTVCVFVPSSVFLARM